MKKLRISTRYRVVYLFFSLLFILILGKIVYLQIFQVSFFRTLARKQYSSIASFSGQRGRIYDTQGRALATNITSYSVYADPQMIKGLEETAQVLAEIFAVSRGDVAEKLGEKTRFVWIKRDISWQEKDDFESRSVPGVRLRRKMRRFYPQSRIAAHILGGVDIDNKGLEGIELFCDEYLRGKEGFVHRFKDSAARGLVFLPESLSPQEGADVYLTVDGQIQYWVERYLDETVREFKARGGSVVVMDPHTGEILAIANWPRFDPNNLGESSFGERRNQAITDMFEPGSVFKIVTLVAALNEGVFSEDDVIFCENGSYKIPGTVLHDYRSHGDLPFRDVFARSSNIGVAKIATELGKEKVYRYIKKLQFGKKTGIDLPGEVSGSIKPPRQWSHTSQYIIPIGQEVGVTLLQMAQAMSIIASRGDLVRPHLIERITHRHYAEPVEIVKKKILSPRVCDRVKAVLAAVVDYGSGRAAQIEGARVGGKTGTAQKFDVARNRYSPNKYRASFVGFVEAEPITFVIAVSIDEPRKSHLGGTVAAPLFGRIARDTLRYLEYRHNIEREP